MPCWKQGIHWLPGMPVRRTPIHRESSDTSPRNQTTVANSCSASYGFYAIAQQ